MFPTNSSLSEETTKVLTDILVQENKYLGTSMGNGDCFYESIAKSLNVENNDTYYTSKVVRILEKSVIEDLNPSTLLYIRDYFISTGMNYNSLLSAISQMSNFLRYIEYTDDDIRHKSLNITTPLWGEPKRDFRFLCPSLNVGFRVLCHEQMGEFSITSDTFYFYNWETQCLEETEYVRDFHTNKCKTLVEIAGDGHHFVPIFIYPMNVHNLNYEAIKSVNIQTTVPMNILCIKRCPVNFVDIYENFMNVYIYKIKQKSLLVILSKDIYYSMKNILNISLGEECGSYKLVGEDDNTLEIRVNVDVLSNLSEDSTVIINNIYIAKIDAEDHKIVFFVSDDIKKYRDIVIENLDEIW